MEIKLEFVKRVIAGETLLVPIGETAKKYSGLFALSELAGFIWEALPDAASEDEIVDKILTEYEVSREEAAADTAEFLGKLREMGILE